VLGLYGFLTSWAWLNKLPCAGVSETDFFVAVKVDESYVGGEEKSRCGRIIA